MNTNNSLSPIIIAALTLSFGTTPLIANEGHKHGDDNDNAPGHSHHVKEAGPNGGRIIEGDEFKLEFFVTENRQFQISFLNDRGDIIPPKDESVSLIGGKRSDPTRVQFEKNGTVLLSQSALPDLMNMPAILQIKPAKGAESVRERFNINMGTCPTCDYHEYACVCGHEEKEEKEHGHQHGPDSDHKHK